jgi:Glycosyl transferase family 21
LVEQLARLTAAALAGALLLQALLCAWFSLLARHRLVQSGEHTASEAWPAAEVVLCLRGVDPALEQVLVALAAQCYPGPWRLLLVVDSRHDPAWTLAEASLSRLQACGAATWQAARLSALAAPPRQGSRKCAALHQAFGDLAASTELVALVDADAVVRPDWLQRMAEACRQPGVGAGGGNRWYLPERCSAPGMVRAIWNGGALVLMTLLAIPWGGSLAIRRSLIEPSGWRQQLRTSLCEDTALTTPLRRSGWRFHFAPQLIAVDRDDSIALRPLIRWIARQLVMARLHHPTWPLVLLHGLGTSLLLLAALAQLLALLLQGALAPALALAAVVLAYELGCGLLLLWIQAVVAQATPLERRLSLSRWLRWLPLAQLVYGLAAWQALLARRVEWSGVIYGLRGRSVEVMEG